MRNIRLALSCVIFLTAIIGCSGSNIDSTSPSLTADENFSTGADNTHLWGMWNVYINPDTGTADIIPTRSVEFTANVTQFMQPPASPTHRLQIKIDNGLTDFLTGYVVVDVTFIHPFAGLDQYTGFDVRGVFMHDGSINAGPDTSNFVAGETNARLLNADGYTRWFNMTEFTTFGTILGFTEGKLGTPSSFFSANVNPYKYLCDGLGSEDDYIEFFGDPGNSNPRGLFSAGSANTRRYELQWYSDGGIPTYNFQYAVIASWEDPAVPPNELKVPESFVISANCHEAYALSVTDLSTIYYAGPGESGGDIRLLTRIFDHQGAVSSAGVAGEINSVWIDPVEGPISSDAIIFQGGALDAAKISEDEMSVTYLFEITGQDIPESGLGYSRVMIGVENVNPADYNSGFPGFAFADSPLTALFEYNIPISDKSPLSLTSIDPDSGALDSMLTGVNVAGAGFEDGMDVWLNSVDDPLIEIYATNVSVTDSNNLTCDFSLDSTPPIGAIEGFYDLKASVPSGSNATSPMAFEIFVYTDPINWPNHMYNVNHTAYNPTASTPDPASLTLDWSSPAPGNYKYTTPVVGGDKIFYPSGGTVYAGTTARVYCFDLLTGSQLWNAGLNPSGFYTRFFTSVSYYEDSGGNEWLIAGGDKIRCWDANSSGTDPAPEWEFDDLSPTDVNWLGTQLVVFQDKVIARARNAASLYILDASDGSLIYEVPVSGGGEGGVGVHNGKVYTNCGIAGGTGEMVCVDIASGSIDWSTPISEGPAHWICPTIADGRIYITSYDGVVFCLAEVDDSPYLAGDLIWTWNDPAESPGSYPLIGGVAKLGSDLFFSSAFSSNHVYCITDNGATASTKWKSIITGYFDSTCTVAVTPSYPNGVVIAPELSGNTYFLDASTGSMAYSLPSVETQRAGVPILEDKIVIARSSTLSVYH
ncbi:MAG TPA: PQQ-binding-like beta-propeller repeat protein [bacterium]